LSRPKRECISRCHHNRRPPPYNLLDRRALGFRSLYRNYDATRAFQSDRLVILPGSKCLRDTELCEGHIWKREQVTAGRPITAVARSQRSVHADTCRRCKCLTVIGFPYAGPVWDLDGAHIWRSFAAWASKFGDIYQVQLFGQKFCILSDPKIAKELLAKQGAICSDRPDIGCVPGSKDSGAYLPFLGHNGMYLFHIPWAVY
jgi:hypothetical protein